jgi:hypothetical protein
MKRHAHGLISLLFVAGATATALVNVWQASIFWGLAYLLLLVGGAGTILFAYCAKCPCRLQGCGHVIPGWLTRFLPARNQGTYGVMDYLGVIIPLVLWVTVPQTWLRHHLPAMILFWMLLAAGSIEILLYVCKGCNNDRCPMQLLRN